MKKKSREQRKIRYAVVGLGYIAQAAVLPAFANARENSELTALVSSDPLKLQKLSKKYGVKQTYSYDQFDQCLSEGEIDAVYIAFPTACSTSIRCVQLRLASTSSVRNRWQLRRKNAKR